MIELACDCGHTDSTPESSASGSWSCPKCGRSIQLACAEELPENAGQGDFDASFTVIDGPDRVGQKILLGGVTPIEIGKLQGKHILLTGNRVSRNHCKLNRVDFGPSRWQVEDTGSTNGTFINDQQITKQELSPGDVLQVGEFQLQFALVEAPAEAVIDLSAAEAQSDPLPAPAYAPPPPPMVSRATPAQPLPHRKGSTLSYQRDAGEGEERLLGECDPKWVMMLRNASSLMVCSIGLRLGAKWWFDSDSFDAGVDMVTSLMTGTAAWLLTMKEPDAVEKTLWAVVRIALRLFATIATIGEVTASLSIIMENAALLIPGLAMSLAGPIQIFLFLFYLRKLASRLPSPGLAVSCIIVMVGLPVSLGIMIYGAIMAVLNPANLAAGGGASLATVGAGLCALVIFAIWYVVILFWFNKSFS